MKLNLKKVALSSCLIALAVSPTLLLSDATKNVYEQTAIEQQTTVDEKGGEGLNIVDATLASSGSVEFEDIAVFSPFENKIYDADFTFNYTAENIGGGSSGFDFETKSLTVTSPVPTEGSYHLPMAPTIVPENIINEGEAATRAYLSSIHYVSSSYYESSYGDNNTYTNDDDLYIALRNDYGNNSLSQGDENYLDLLEIPIIHFTYQNDLEYNESSVFYDNADDDSVEIKIKTKSGYADAFEKNINGIDKDEFEAIEDTRIYTYFDAKDFQTSEDKTYYVSIIDNDYKDGTYFLNQISKISTIYNIDLSDKAFDTLRENISENEDVYIRIPTIYFALPTKIADFDKSLITDSGYDINETFGTTDFYSDLIKLERSRGYALFEYLNLPGEVEPEYNYLTNGFLTYYVQNDNSYSSSSGTVVYPELQYYDGSLYFIEKFSISPSIYSAASSNRIINSCEIVADILKGDNFNEMIENMSFRIIEEARVYSESGYEDSYVFYKDYDVLSGPGFMSNSEITLIVFTLLSFILLALVILLLVMSGKKENDEIVIIGGEK